jgi:hypothetical protein
MAAVVAARVTISKIVAHTYFLRPAGRSKTGLARPRDVLSVPAGSGADRAAENIHSAQFPVGLVEPIIRMLCPHGQITLSSAVVKRNRRHQEQPSLCWIRKGNPLRRGCRAPHREVS